MTRRHKARDISHLTPHTAQAVDDAFLVYRFMYEDLGVKPLELDFKYAIPLGHLGRQLVSCIVDHLKGYSRNTCYASTYLSKSILGALLKLPVVPTGWEDLDWAAFLNNYIVAFQRSPVGDRLKNRLRSYVIAVFQVAFRREYLDPIKFVDPIRNASGGKKSDIASVRQNIDFDYSTMSTQQAQLARRLEQLTDIADPEIHRERLSLMLEVLNAYTSREMRRASSDFTDIRKFIEGDEGIDVDAFLAEWRIEPDELRLKKGWQKLFQDERDVFRLLAHPEVLPTFLSGGKTQIRKMVYTVHPGVNFWERMFPTAQNIVPFHTRLMLDLNLEVSSASGMVEGCVTHTDEPSTVQIEWKKGRSGEMQSEACPIGSPMSLETGDSSEITSYEVLRQIKSMKYLLPKWDENNGRERVFTVANCNGINPVHDQTLYYRFQQFREKDPILKAFYFSQDKIRPSVILLEQLTSNDIFKTQRKARHKLLGTTIGYVDTVSVAHGAVKRRREVQDLLLLNALPDHKHLRVKLGMTGPRTRHIVDQARRAGFGEWHPMRGLQRTSDPLPPAPLLMQQLLSGEHVVIETPEVAAEFIAYRDHLQRMAHGSRCRVEWLDEDAITLLYFTKALHLMAPDVRLAGERLAEQHVIEYSEDL